MPLRHGKLTLLFFLVFCAACQPASAAAVTPAATRTPAPIFTDTPTSTGVPPTATPTPHPLAREFKNEFDQAPSGWSFLQVDNGQPAHDPGVDSGFLVFELPGPNQWIYSIYEGHSYSDVLIEAQVQTRTAGDGAAGLVCRYGQGQGWYELDVYSDQTYQLLYGQWLAQGIARYTPLYRGQSSKIDADSNDIGLLCEGDNLTPVINGTPMRKWQELKFKLQSGKVGISASSFEDAPFRIAYDWVKVIEP